MAQPFMVLGLKGPNTVIDKYFDNVPDKLLHPATYHSANLTSSRLRRRTREKANRGKSKFERKLKLK
jgi:hypothetical protein